MRHFAPIFVLLLLFAGSTSCEKEGVDPEAPISIIFRNDRGCTYGNDTVAAGDTLLVGTVAAQGGQTMRFFRVHRAYDGGVNVRTDSVNINADPFHFDKTIVLRTVPGTEKWTFSVVKANGDITLRSLTFTVP